MGFLSSEWTEEITKDETDRWEYMKNQHSETNWRMTADPKVCMGSGDNGSTVIYYEHLVIIPIYTKIIRILVDKCRNKYVKFC